MTSWARTVAVAGLVGLVGLSSVFASPVAIGQPLEAGDAFVSSAGGNRLDEGGSATRFTLRLPDGAECPGDSAFEGWRVNSYMVPEAVDVTAQVYDGLGPTPFGLGDYDSFRQPLYDVRTTENYASALTAAVQVRGEPGPIVDIPMFSLAVYEPGDVPAGRYHIGIACTLLNVVGRVWDVEIIVAEAADDAPAELHWQVADRGGPGGSGSSLPTAWAATAAAVALGLVFARTRRRSASGPGHASRRGSS